MGSGRRYPDSEDESGLGIAALLGLADTVVWDCGWLLKERTGVAEGFIRGRAFCLVCVG